MSVSCWCWCCHSCGSGSFIVILVSYWGFGEIGGGGISVGVMCCCSRVDVELFG